MKVLAISGSMRGKKSLCNKVINAVLDNHYWDEWEKKIRTIDTMNISMCQGCCSCFASGKCPIEDDMSNLKGDIIDSDVIIVASPVFLHQISGCLKNLIDRIAYWTHTFELLNKRVILCAATATTGCEYVLSYLKKAFSAMGAYIIYEIAADVYMENEDLEQICEQVIQKMKESYMSEEISATFYQEQLFQSLKALYMQQNSYESEIWRKRGYFLCDNFVELQNR